MPSGQKELASLGQSAGICKYKLAPTDNEGRDAYRTSAGTGERPKCDAPAEVWKSSILDYVDIQNFVKPVRS